MKTLSYGRQQIDQDDIESVVRALKSDYLTCGPEIARFEEELAQYCQSKYAVVCANGTAALHLVSLSLGIDENSEVISSPLTFAATTNSALYCGAKVTFVDVDPTTGCIDPAAVEKYILSRPKQDTKLKAIYAIHFAGMIADLKALREIANKYKLHLVEDACHAIGSSYRVDGKVFQTGSCAHSEMSVFSFHPVKNMTTGEGGAITLNDENLYQRLIELRAHGIVRDPQRFANRDIGFSGSTPNRWYHEMQGLGYNYRLTDIQAALGRSQLKKLDGFISKRQQIATWYRAALKEARIPATPLYPNEVFGHSYHLFPVLIPFDQLGTTRENLMGTLAKESIYTQVHYIPVHKHPYYQELIKTGQVQVFSSANAEAYYSQCLSLPIFPAMDQADVLRVTRALTDWHRSLAKPPQAHL